MTEDCHCHVKAKAKIVGGRLVVKPYIALMQALEEGCGFAINRLEECGWKNDMKDEDYEHARASARDRMINEISIAIFEYFDIEDEASE